LVKKKANGVSWHFEGDIMLAAIIMRRFEAYFLFDIPVDTFFDTAIF